MQTEATNKAGITENVLGRLAKDMSISMGSMKKICGMPKCDIADAMEFVN